MNARIQIRLLLATLLCAAAAIAAGASSPQDVVRVMTYNVQFLPGPASSQDKRPEPEYRARRIADEAANFDVVALEETFDEGCRKIILDTLREKWDGQLNVVISPKPDGFFTNGGCLIATRLPIIEFDAVVYKHFSSPADYGFRADGFAAKGVIFARIARSKDDLKECIDVFATHLEARADELRPEQYKEMAAFIKAKSDPANPLLLMGDFNTRGDLEYRNDPNSQYSQLFAALNSVRPVTDVWPALHGDALGGTTEQESDEIGHRIDYVIVGSQQDDHPALKPMLIQVNAYRDDRVYALSDHNAVEAELDWADVAGESGTK